MGLESVMFWYRNKIINSIDNSEFSRNGDYDIDRLFSQTELGIKYKLIIIIVKNFVLRVLGETGNAESTVGLVLMGSDA